MLLSKFKSDQKNFKKNSKEKELRKIISLVTNDFS